MNKITLSTTLILGSMTFNAQIKVWSGTNTPTVIGSTSATSVVGHELQVIGKSIFTAGTGTVTSAPYIMGTSSYSSASAPDYTWKKDSTTGIFHSNLGNLSIASAGQERMRVTGIGFTYSYATGFYFPSSTSAITSCAAIYGTNSWGAANIPEYTWYNDPDCGLFHPAADNIALATNGTERMRITANGLLIGSSSDPGNVRLSVTAASNCQAIYSSTTYSTNYNYHQINNVNQALTKALAIQLNGADKFVVNGNGDIWYNGSITSSDRNLKENIDTLKDALSKVLQLQGCTYNYKPAVAGMPHPKKQMGLIAQDVEAIVPEVVSTNDKGLKGIAYQNLTALLIEAIKEQNRKITQLQNDLGTCCSKTGNRMQGDESNNGPDQRIANTSPGAKLWQNIPNPFSQTTTIKCFIPDTGKTVTILVFDLTGALKKTVPVNGKGEINVTINAKELVAGMYHYSLIVDGQEIDTKKMILTE